MWLWSQTLSIYFTTWNFWHCNFGFCLHLYFICFRFLFFLVCLVFVKRQGWESCCIVGLMEEKKRGTPQWWVACIVGHFGFGSINILEALEVVILLFRCRELIFCVCVCMCYRCDSRSTADGFSSKISCVCVWFVNLWLFVPMCIWISFFNLIQEAFDVESRGRGFLLS